VFVASSIQHAICMHHIFTCSLPSSTHIFQLYIIKAQFSGKNGYWTWRVCFDFLYNIYLKHFSFYEEMCEIWSKIKSLPAKLHLLSDCNETWIYSTNVRKILKCQIAWKSVQWEPSCSLPKDGQTDMTKLIVACRSFTKAPKNTNKTENWQGCEKNFCVVIQGRSCHLFRGS
jgi:hypothetical protein